MLKHTVGMTLVACMALSLAQGAETRVGVIGLDTSHSLAFTEMLNAENKEPAFEGFRVTVAHKFGSLDIPSSTSPCWWKL